MTKQLKKNNSCLSKPKNLYHNSHVWGLRLCSITTRPDTITWPNEPNWSGKQRRAQTNRSTHAWVSVLVRRGLQPLSKHQTLGPAWPLSKPAPATKSDRQANRARYRHHAQIGWRDTWNTIHPLLVLSFIPTHTLCSSTHFLVCRLYTHRHRVIRGTHKRTHLSLVWSGRLVQY